MDQALRVDTSPFSQLDHRFLAILLATMATHVVVATWVARQPARTVDAELEDPIDRFTHAPLLPIPKVMPPVRVAKATPAPAPGPSAPRAGPGRAGPTDGLLGLVGSFRKDLDHDDVAGILDGARHGAVDPLKLGTRREGSEAQAQDIGPLTTHGVGDVVLAERQDLKLLGRADGMHIDDPPPEVQDPEALQRFIRAHRLALASCYELGLKHHRELRGKLSIRFTLTLLGRADQVSIFDDSLGSSEVSECLISTVRRWVFPFKPDAEAPVQFPVLFAPAQ